ncbi:MAG: anaerobic ribonucleoside-triphosphate reductase activating protein [Schaedlerella sp.]|nr:anaerobic ribonucleoside-triphosphate reductase activating protein [Schaedlerella sp.]
MKIVGIQKMTLLDYPGKIACTVFLNGCNFLCPYCHNSELLNSEIQELMDENGFFSFLEKRTGLLDAVCISGGEPTLHSGLEAFIRKIKKMGYLVKLDTNGYRPEILRHLLEENLLDYVAMDIKNDLEHYELTAGVKNFDGKKIIESMKLLVEGNTEYEFRTTVAEEFHNEKSFEEINKLFQSISGEKKIKKYFLQPFVDRDTVMFSNLHAPNVERLKIYAKYVELSVDDIQIRGI